MANKNDKYYGFNTQSVNEKFEGNLTYCNTFCIKGEYLPVAVYKSTKPNREKGHKDYLLLCATPKSGTILVRGMDEEEMKKWRFQSGIRCLRCNDVIFSRNRHDMRYCNCESVAIDGGADYTKITGNFEDYEQVTIDLIKDEVTEKLLE